MLLLEALWWCFMNGSVRSALCVWNELLWPARDKAHYKVVHTHTKSFHNQPGTLKTLIRSFGATQRRNYVTTAPEHFRSSSQQGSSPHSSLRLRPLRKSDTIYRYFCEEGDCSPVGMAMSTFQKVTLATGLVLCVALLLPKMLLSRGRKDAAERPEGMSHFTAFLYWSGCLCGSYGWFFIVS